MLLQTLNLWSDPELRQKALHKVEQFLTATVAVEKIVSIWYHVPKNKLGVVLGTVGTIGALKDTFDQYDLSLSWIQKYDLHETGFPVSTDLVFHVIKEHIPHEVRKESDGQIYIFHFKTEDVYLWANTDDSNFSGFFTRSGELNFVSEVSEVLWKHFDNKISLDLSKETTLTEYTPKDREYFGPNNEDLICERLDLYGRIGETSRALLMVGPPGTGKSTIAHRVAMKRGNRILRIFPSASVEDSNISYILRIIKLLNPSAIVIDDLDKLDSTYFLLQLVEGIRHLKNVLLIATINHLSEINEGLRRPERFDDIILFDSLDEPYHSEHVKHVIKSHDGNIDTEEAVESSRGLPPAYVNEAILFAIATGHPVAEKVQHMKMIMGISDDE